MIAGLTGKKSVYKNFDSVTEEFLGEIRQTSIDYLRSMLTDEQRRYIDGEVSELGYSTDRGTGRTFAKAIYCLCWMIDYPGEWLVLVDHYPGLQGSRVLHNEMRLIYRTTLEKIGYKLSERTITLEDGCDSYVACKLEK